LQVLSELLFYCGETVIRTHSFEASHEAHMPGKLFKGREKPKIPLPTAAESRLLHILWDKGEATVEAVVNAHPEEERPNYKTTQTLLRIMEQKGLITHESRGRVFVFRPLIDRKTIDQRAVQALLSQNFAGSARDLFVNLLEAGPVKEEELDELESYIREYRKRSEAEGHNRE
jgi:BlaI family transcriptional regulator, penicillinase repressor